MTGAPTQLRALLALRWTMVRTPGLKLAIVLGGLALLWLLDVVLSSGRSLEPAALATAVDLAPAAFLGFGALAVVAPLTSGGGNDVVPPDQLVAYPVRPRTQFYGGLLLAPLNLVWLVQLLVLAALTSYLTVEGSVLLGGVTTLAYVVCLTVLGQTLAWFIVGARRSRAGRRVVVAAAVSAVLAAVVLVRTGAAGGLLAQSPTRTVVHGVAAAGTADSARWVAVTGGLLGLAVVGLLLGARVCAWSLGRAGDAGADRHTSPVRRRTARGGPLRELVAVDRASVWRAPALRRGGLVLAILPGLAAAGVQLPWQSLIVLPGLVAAGAGLLFGINAFCLDGSGALWLASLPHDPALVARAKLIVLTETVLAAALLAVLAGSARSPGLPTPTELSAIVASGLVCTALVVASCLRASVRRPHRADLRGPRDAVAPPGALAVASARLTLPTALVGLVLAQAAVPEIWWWPPLLALPVLLLALLSVLRSLRRYAEPAVRARVVQVVSTG